MAEFPAAITPVFSVMWWSGNILLLSVLKTIVLLNIFVETMIYYQGLGWEEKKNTFFQ